MGVGSGLSYLSALSPRPYPPHLVYLVHNCSIPYYTVAEKSAMSSMLSKWQSPEGTTPWSSVDVSNCTLIQQAAK